MNKYKLKQKRKLGFKHTKKLLILSLSLVFVFTVFFGGSKVFANYNDPALEISFTNNVSKNKTITEADNFSIVRPGSNQQLSFMLGTSMHHFVRFTDKDVIKMVAKRAGTISNNYSAHKTNFKAGDTITVVNGPSGSTYAFAVNGSRGAVFPESAAIKFTFTFTNPDNKSPVVSGETTFINDVDDPKDSSYFMQFLSAQDETDGDVTASLKITADNHTANKRVLGNHTFTVEASDKAGNKATAVINVRTVDITKPVITGNASTASVGYKETYNIENFRKTLLVTDNYDQLSNSNISLKTDGYTSNKNKLGTYNIIFTAKDSSGNEGTFTKPILVIDNVKPTFSGPTTIATSNTTVLTEADVRAQISAYDEIDGNITNKIELVEDNYTGKGNIVGSYTIKYKVTDNAGNTEHFTTTIMRSDKIPPVIWVQDGVSIRTDVDTPISYEIIIDILQATGQITVNASTTFSFPMDEYTGNESTPGIYALSVKSKSTDGNEKIVNLSIVVNDIEDDGGITVDPDKNIVIDWITENMSYIIIAGVSLAAIGVFVFLRKKRK